MFKKGDAVILALLAAAALCFLLFAFTFKGAGETVVIKKGNKVVYEESINKDAAFKLDGNTVLIKNGKVFMKDATCKNQICVKHKEISKKGETIVCLPHKVLVEVH